MGFFSWLKEKLGFDDDDFDDIGYGYTSDNAESLMQSLANVSRKRRTLNMNDKVQREEYVREYCDMMAIASKDVEAQKIEYEKVSERLADLDEIAKLSMTEKSKVRLCAKSVIQAEEEESSYTRPARKITEAQYREMESMRDEIPDIIKKLKEQEDYQMVVRRDLNLLEGEKGAIAYTRKEERARAKKAKNSSLIGLFLSLTVCMLLFMISKTMRVDMQLGYMIVAAAFALILTSACVSYQNAQSNIARANRKLNKTISLQNTVKIKYVNVTNVLDYNYAKYNVMNSYELGYMWEKYNEEKAIRRQDSEIEIRLERVRGELYQLLKSYGINDPSVWVHQPGVLVVDNEEKTIRKSLVVQRQRLKKGIDFEMYNLDVAKKEVQSLVREYPKYASEIIAIVEEYE